MKKKVIISIFILIVIIGFVIAIILYNNNSISNNNSLLNNNSISNNNSLSNNNSNIIAHVDINIPTRIESSTKYTYYIGKKNNGNYTYKKVKTEMWISEITSEKTVNSGNINNKEDLEMIQKDIDNSKDNYPIEGYSNVGIYYQNEKLNTLEELSEKLFEMN